MAQGRGTLGRGGGGGGGHLWPRVGVLWVGFIQKIKGILWP